MKLIRFSLFSPGNSCGGFGGGAFDPVQNFPGFQGLPEGGILRLSVLNDPFETGNLRPFQGREVCPETFQGVASTGLLDQLFNDRAWIVAQKCTS